MLSLLRAIRSLKEIKPLLLVRQYMQKSKWKYINYKKYIYFTATAVGIAAIYTIGCKLPNQSLQPMLLNWNDSDKSLRQQFNFIDKVVQKCASSVVYIEIKDIKKFDIETGEPQISSNGSGFLINEDGWILTNAHVVINKPYNLVMVKMNDGTVYQASVEDADMNVDLALLKIKDNRTFPYLRFGNSSQVNTGEWVIALGSPLSLSHSVTAGVISSVDRGADELGLRNFSMRYLQTDAAITFGNSGGPLVNLDGEVIGINNLRVTAGIAFAIPIDYAKKFLMNSRLRKTPHNVNYESDKVNVLGITTMSVTPLLITQLHEVQQTVPEDLTHGVLVWKVLRGTPAHKSGLIAGDIITHVNGLPVQQVMDIYVIFKKTSNNNKLSMKIVRDSIKKDIVIKIMNISRRINQGKRR